jgi:hypothetical protein
MICSQAAHGGDGESGSPVGRQWRPSAMMAVHKTQGSLIYASHSWKLP